jgi:hypothetical protein
MQAEEPPVDRLWTMSTTLWPDNRPHSHRLRERKEPGRRKFLRKSHQRSRRQHNAAP